jgi:hypothetical protein
MRMGCRRHQSTSWPMKALPSLIVDSRTRCHSTMSLGFERRATGDPGIWRTDPAAYLQGARIAAETVQSAGAGLNGSCRWFRSGRGASAPRAGPEYRADRRWHSEARPLFFFLEAGHGSIKKPATGAGSSIKPSRLGVGLG